MIKRILTVITLFALSLLLSWGYGFLRADDSLVIAQTNQNTPTQNTQNTQMNEIDRQFLLDAGQASVGNIMMSQLALKESNNSQVKDFANAEIQEQTKVRNDLMKIAPQAGVTLSERPAPKHQAAMTRLSQLNGEQFDQAYMDEGGINAHLENAALFQREAAFGQNPDLVSVATQGLPIIKQHFNTASAATNYQFAQVARNYNQTTPVSGTLPRQNNTKPTVP
jgi:putative membrane protein